jgi:hypothetical protein
MLLQRRHVDDGLHLYHQMLVHQVRQLMVHLMENDMENFREHLFHLCAVHRLNQVRLQDELTADAQQNQDVQHLDDCLTLVDVHLDELVVQEDVAYLFHLLHYRMDYFQHVVDVALGWLFRMDYFQQLLDAVLLEGPMNLNLLLAALALHAALGQLHLR